MVLFQALWLMLSPASSTTELVLGLAVVAAALLVAAAAALSLPLVETPAPASFARPRAVAIPRLSDPDAAGRPRRRAPSVCPAAG